MSWGSDKVELDTKEEMTQRMAVWVDRAVAMVEASVMEAKKQVY